MFSKQIEFLAIGDIVTDAFVRLREAHVTCNIDKENCELCMKFGDKIPYDSVTVVKAVGNSANAAVSAARLGLRSSLAANVGDDQDGADCIAELKRNGVDARFVPKHRGIQTNYHYVLWYGDERTILVKHQNFAYHLPKISKNPKWVYVSSLGGTSYEYNLEIIKWLEANPDIKVAFQPGTFQMGLGLDKLAGLYRRSDVFFCNKEEAQRILGTTESDAKALMAMLREKGPKLVLLTDGPHGAYAYDGTDALFMPPYPDPKAPYERTGAGDAFASTFTVALALGKTLQEALRWAPINSAYVVQDIGAQRGLLTRARLEELLAQAPNDYRPRSI